MCTCSGDDDDLVRNDGASSAGSIAGGADDVHINGW